MNNKFLILFSRNSEVPGNYVRISREQQGAIDEEVTKAVVSSSQTGAIPKRRKRQFVEVRSEEIEDPVPSSVVVNVKMLQYEISRHVDDVIAQWSVEETQMRLDRLESIWQKIKDFWDSLDSLAMTSADSDRCIEFCTQAWDEYIPYKAKLQRFLGRAQKHPTNSASAMAVNSSGQLIQIQLSEPPKLKKFSGLEVDWANFRAIYETEVHNNPRFSNTQKMNHLLGALQGRAAAAYANWPILGESSYEILWADICNKFSNEYNTISAHLQAVQALAPLNKPTCDAMRKIIDVARSSFRQLQLLLKPELIAEYMLLYQIEGLLDAESQMQWGLRRSTETLPTLAQLFEFMELRASMLRGVSVASLPTGRSDEQRNAQSSGAQSSAQRGFSVGRGDEQRPPCDLCPGLTHWPFKCSKFRAKSILERTDYTMQRQMCHNCFSLKHKTANCPDKGCFKCKKLHNSCLCPLNTNLARPLVSSERMKSGPEAFRFEATRKAAETSSQ